MHDDNEADDEGKLAFAPFSEDHLGNISAFAETKLLGSLRHILEVRV